MPTFVQDAITSGSFPASVDEYLAVNFGDDPAVDLPAIESRKTQVKGRELETASSAPSADPAANKLGSLSTDVLGNLLSYLPTEEGTALWKLGDKELKQKMSQLRVVRLVPPVADSFQWPAEALGHFTRVKDLTISAPEFYEHMPFEGFNAKDLPTSVETLTLNFRNAAHIFQHCPQLTRALPHLKSLTINSIDGPRIVFTSTEIDENDVDPDVVFVSPECINGIEVLRLPKFEMSLTDVNELPHNLNVLSAVHINESGDSGYSFNPVWPPNLTELEVNAHQFSGAVLDERGLSLAALKFLTRLSFSCVQNEDDIAPHAIKESLAKLHHSLTHLELRVSGAKFTTDFDDLPFQPSLLADVPKSLESLIIWDWPTNVDISKITDGPKNLSTLRIHHKPARHGFEVSDPSFPKLPRSITDLKLPANAGDCESDGFEDNLAELPPTLTKFSFCSLHPVQISLLPQSLTDLTLDFLNEKEPEEDFDPEAQAEFFPPLKRLVVEHCDDGAVFPLDKLFHKTLEFLHLNNHRGTEESEEEGVTADSYPIGANLKHYSEGIYSEKELWIDITKKLPATLQSYRIPFNEAVEPLPREGLHEFLAALPRSLTALSLLGVDAETTPEDFANAPPHLVFLEVLHLEGPTRENLAKLPKTLRVISCENADQIPAEILPPHCKALKPYYVAPRSLEGEWWRVNVGEETGEYIE